MGGMWLWSADDCFAGGEEWGAWWWDFIKDSKKICVITPVLIVTCKIVSKNHKIPSDKIGLFVIKYIERKILLC